MAGVDIGAVVFLLAITLVLFKDFAFAGGRVLSMPTADGWSQYLGWRYYAAEALRSWRVPLWNPYYLSGLPFMAESQTAVFYPLTLLFAILPIGYAFNWTFIVHIFMGGAFTYLLLRVFGIGGIASLFGAIAFELSSPVILQVVPGHMSNIITVSWTPLLFLCVEVMVRRRSGIAALVTGLVVAWQFLGGHAQYFYYSMLGATLFFCYRVAEDCVERRSVKVAVGHIARYALAVGGGMALCAVQVLPMLELVGESVRRATEWGGWAATFSFPPENFGTLVVPDLFGDDLTLRYWGRWYAWEMIAYFGIGTLVLGMLAVVIKRTRRVWFFAGLGIFSATAALGGHTPLLGVLQRVLPGFALFRGHSKFVFLLGLSLAVLSALGLQGFIDLVRERDEKRVRQACWALGIMAFVGVATCIVMGMEIWPGTAMWKRVVHGMTQVERSRIGGAPPWVAEKHSVASYPFFQKSVIYSTIFLVVTVGLLVPALVKGRWGKRVAVAVTLVLLVDLWSFGSKRVEALVAPVRLWTVEGLGMIKKERMPLAFALESCFFDGDLAEFFKSQREPFRVMEMGVPFTMLPGYVTGRVETIMGFSPVAPGRYQKFFNYSEGRRLEEMSAGIIPIKAGRLYSLLNMRYVVTTDYWESLNEEEYSGAQLRGEVRSGVVTKERYERVPRIEGKMVFEKGGLKVWENEDAMPRAYIVHSYEIVKGDEEILDRLSSPEFDPRDAVILEEGPEGFEEPSGENVEEWVKVASYEPERVVIEATFASPGFVVLADMYYPGWVAEVDGERAKIYRANYLLRAVVLGEGKHTVEFKYVPVPYRVGRVISLVVLLGFLGGLIGLGVRVVKGR